MRNIVYFTKWTENCFLNNRNELLRKLLWLTPETIRLLYDIETTLLLPTRYLHLIKDRSGFNSTEDSCTKVFRDFADKHSGSNRNYLTNFRETYKWLWLWCDKYESNVIIALTKIIWFFLSMRMINRTVKFKTIPWNGDL